MPRKTEEKPTYDYNIYKISLNKTGEFKKFLSERQFEDIPLKNELVKDSNGFSFELMFCDKDNHKGSPWVSLLSSCSKDDLIQNLKIYGAALICESANSCYVVSYGNAHFYLSNFCNYNFGIMVAERLINLDSIKAQQNISHGGKLSKTHIDYLSSAALSYKGGEIPTYIKGRSINENIWGKSINCGTSAQFKWEEKPLEIGKKLHLLDEALNTPSAISLPHLIPLNDETDSDKIESLFAKLSESIDDYDINTQYNKFVNVPSFYMIGTKIIQNDSVRFKLSCNRKHSEYDGELSITAIKNFVQEKELDICKDIKNIKLSVEYSNDLWTNYKPLMEYLEFVTEDNFCLRNGKWCAFNNAYLEQVMRDVEKVKFENHIDELWNFNKFDLMEFAKEKGIYAENDHQPYETYYNARLSEFLGGNMIHPETISIDDKNKKYKYEVCDLICGRTMYFVKIGQPSDFIYAVDQAALTLSKIQNGYGKVTLPDKTEFEANEFHIVLVCKNRTRKITKWSDIGSINFLIHISELKQNLNIMNISLVVDFAYDNQILNELNK